MSSLAFYLLNQESSTKQDAEMKFFAVVFATVVVQVLCRSVVLSNMKNAGEKTSLSTEDLKEMATAYEKNFTKFIEFARSQDKNKIQRDVSNQLGMLIDQIIKEQSKAANMYINLNNVINSILQRASSKSINDSNDFKDLIDAVKEINNMYQNDNITNGHIRTKRTFEEHKEAASYTTIEKQIANMLTDILRQLTQNQNYLEKLCKKHHSPSTVISELNTNIN